MRLVRHRRGVDDRTRYSLRSATIGSTPSRAGRAGRTRPWRPGRTAAHAPNVSGSSRVTPNSRPSSSRRAGSRAGEAGSDAEAREDRALPQHQRQHLRALRAERHADPDLARALHHARRRARRRCRSPRGCRDAGEHARASPRRNAAARHCSRPAVPSAASTRCRRSDRRRARARADAGIATPDRPWSESQTTEIRSPPRPACPAHRPSAVRSRSAAGSRRRPPEPVRDRVSCCGCRRRRRRPAPGRRVLPLFGYQSSVWPTAEPSPKNRRATARLTRSTVGAPADRRRSSSRPSTIATPIAVR